MMDLIHNSGAVRAAFQEVKENVEPWEVTPTDAALLATAPRPEPMETPYDRSDAPIRLVSDPAESQPTFPQFYGPITIQKRIPSKVNCLNQLQAFARGQLVLEDGRQVWVLVTAFGESVGLIDQLKVGAQYDLRGVLTQKVETVKGVSVVSTYLSLE